MAISVMLWSLVVFASGPVSARPTCFPQFTSLDVFESVEINRPRRFEHHLASMNSDGRFPTGATVAGRFDGQEQLGIEFRFDVEGVSLPFNIYAVLVTMGTEALAWYDLTENCDDPPVSIFPGDSYRLPDIELNNGGTADLHLIVWGRL